MAMGKEVTGEEEEEEIYANRLNGEKSHSVTAPKCEWEY